MDFNFTEEQDMVRDGLSRLVREQYDWEARREAIASEAGWRPEIWAQLAELGILGMPFSEDVGGFGGGAIDAMIVMEEFGKGLVVEPFVPTVVCAGGFHAQAGTHAHREEHLSAIIDGSRVFAFAYAEPRGRYDYADLETTAKKDGNGYVLNGHKAVVIGAPWSSHLVVTARTGGERRDREGVSVFIVDKSADGIVTRDYETVDGRRASEIYFENVSVPADALIGEEGAGLPLIERVTDHAIAAQCAEACGAMKVAHAMTLEYSKQRKQFGVPIGKFQVLQHRMVDMYTAYETSVSLTYLA
ncbi:MAG: acyl-CoA dehydrogenase, partial [Pseudomonadota bacterium]|nr:acyl-CoA dehydrogenase [Pseudomonadota bacterium]